ncbi:hypothetical protein HPB48_018090 [Haemaphysalis longicornis]|uniref:Calponin-homology (CH) domain-containing protein n=1 Tax=Haemaphysalis longicornis TaxID=44386 RepID=A0A9J6FUM8_HAELO|nr:hypothetical protein HPB48_018090 [Haemaphysalis longicornis]
MSRSVTPTSLLRSVGSAGDLIIRNQLIAWINGRLESNFASFEDLSSGEAYCDLLPKLRSGSLPPKKVRRGARSEHDRVLNFKLLQQGLDKARMRREFRIESLVAGRFRDHYELLKWFRRLFDATHANRDVGSTGSACAATAASGTTTNFSSGSGGSSARLTPTVTSALLAAHAQRRLPKRGTPVACRQERGAHCPCRQLHWASTGTRHDARVPSRRTKWRRSKSSPMMRPKSVTVTAWPCGPSKTCVVPARMQEARRKEASSTR